MLRAVSGLILIVCLLIQPSPGFSQNSPSELFLVAQKAFEDGFYDVSIRYIEQLQQEFPQNEKKTEARLLLGQCYFFKSHYLKAYEVFESLLDETKYKDITLFWLGETYLKGADYSQAGIHYEQLIQQFPNSSFIPQALYSLGWVAYEQGEFEKATQIFKNIVKRFPTHPLAEDSGFKVGECAFQQKNYREAIDYYLQYLNQYLESGREGEVYFYIAESYYYLSDPLNAITYYAKASEVSFDHKLKLMAKISLGWAYLKLEKYTLAQNYFEEAETFAREKNILTDDIFLGQAHLATELKQYDTAMAAYEQIIQLFPGSKRLPEALLGKANIQYKLNQFADAITTYDEVIDLTQDNPVLSDLFEKAYFGKAWSNLKSGSIDLAVENFKAIKNTTSNDTVKISAMTQIADAYQDESVFQKAIDVYDEILLAYPESPYTDYVQYRQGLALLKKGELKAAKLSFQSLQANFPNSAYAKDTNYYLAISYYQNKNWKLSKEYGEAFINTASSQHEFLADTYLIYGLSLFELKKYEDSVQVFQRIIKKFPLNEELVRTAQLNIAKCLYQNKDVPSALKKFKILLEKKDHDETAQETLIWLGDHYLKTGEYASAAIYYQRYLKTFPDSEQASLVRYELGRTYESLGEYEKAIAAFKQISIEKNRDMYVKAKLAIADIFSRELDPASAIETYRRIIETSPEFKRDAYVKIAEVQKSNQQFPDAILSYKTAIGSPLKSSLYKDPYLYFELADTFELAENEEAAIETYLKIHYLFPKETSWIVKSFLRMARIFENKEDWDQARLTYSKIMQYNSPERKFARERLDWIKDHIK